MAKKLYLPKNVILTEDISEDYLFAAILKENKLAVTEKNIDILAEAIVNGSVVLVEADTKGQAEAKKDIEDAKKKKEATHSAAKKVAIGALTGAAVGALAGHVGTVASGKMGADGKGVIPGATWDNDVIKKVGEWTGEHKGATAGIGAGAGAAVGMGAGAAKAAHDAKKDEKAANEKLANEDKKVADDKAKEIKKIKDEIAVINAQLEGDDLSDKRVVELHKRMKQLQSDLKKASA